MRNKHLYWHYWQICGWIWMLSLSLPPSVEFLFCCATAPHIIWFNSDAQRNKSSIKCIRRCCICLKQICAPRPPSFHTAALRQSCAIVRVTCERLRRVCVNEFEVGLISISQGCIHAISAGQMSASTPYSLSLYTWGSQSWQELTQHPLRTKLGGGVGLGGRSGLLAAGGAGVGGCEERLSRSANGDISLQLLHLVVSAQEAAWQLQRPQDVVMCRPKSLWPKCQAQPMKICHTVRGPRGRNTSL